MKDILLNLSETLKVCGPSFLADSNGSVILELTTFLVLLLKKQHPCQMDDDEDVEEEGAELAESAEYDWAVVDAAMDVCLGLACTLGEQYGDVWKIVSSHLIKYASSHEPRERSTAVGVIAENIKEMGEAVTPYTEKLLKVLMHRLSDEDSDTRANATYAMGMLAVSSKADNLILPAYPTILGKLESVLSAGPDTNPRILDNAAGCVARMVIAHADQLPLQDLLNALLGLLPLKEDYEENEPVFDMLVKLYQEQNQAVFSVTQRLVPVFAAVLAPQPEGQLKDETRQKVVELVKFVGGKEPSLLQGYPTLQQL